MATRSVALLLSMLPAADRRWLLEQLEPAQQQRIAPVLRAVLQLPVATRKREAARLSQGPLLQPERSSAEDEPVDELQPLIARIDQVDPSQMAALWRGSPSWLLQAFLSIHSWRCRASLQALLPTAPGHRLAPTAYPTLLRKKLLESVLAALDGSKSAPFLERLP